MSSFTETHRSFVNTWECDENAHLNVQFYLKRFDESARFFGALNGTGFECPLPRVRHVRFHAELHAGAITRTRSAAIGDGTFAGCVVHVLDNMETGAIAATALDTPNGQAGTGPCVGAAEVERALPRGVDPGAADPLTGAAILDRGGLIAHRSIVCPAECDAAGELLQQFYVARFTDGAPHVWEKAGIGMAWLRERNLGRVALEMKITHHAAARAGDALVLYSVPALSEGKTLRLHHELVRFHDERPIVTAEVVAVLLDLSTRRTVALPLDARAATAG